MASTFYRYEKANTGIKRKRALGRSILQGIVHLLAWLPLALLVNAALTDQLTVNPIQEATQRLGRAAILVLTAALMITPVQIITGWRGVQRLARPLGLYAFFYALMHVFLFVGIDYGFSFDALAQDINNKSYIFIGLAAFIILLALAVTSFHWWMKRLGKRWKQLHRLVYAAGVLAVVHYGFAVKGDLLHLRGNETQPALYGLVILSLLAVRIPPIRRAVIRTRSRISQNLFRKPQTMTQPRDIV